MKKLTILGSTGSVGRSTLAVVARFPDRLRVEGLSGGRNVKLLREQVEKYRPAAVAVGGGEPDDGLRAACEAAGCRLLSGKQAVSELASLEGSDVVVAAVAGAAGLEPTLSAVGTGKRVALANKEVMVMAGELVLKSAARSGAEILPVDSEHNAIFQCLQGQRREALRRVLLCASGGPFLGRKRAELERVTVAEALDHPRWNMGRKISIDSATMMNKGLEMIEARWFFGLEPEQISVVVHPQSVVHSLVEFADGSVLAQLSRTDMEMPILYCLSYPERWADSSRPLDLPAVSPLEFFEPDRASSPSLELAREALAAGGTMPAVLNAADEEAVEAFLAERIPFTAITEVVAVVMERHEPGECGSLEGIQEADRWAREAARQVILRFQT